MNFKKAIILIIWLVSLLSFLTKDQEEVIVTESVNNEISSDNNERSVPEYIALKILKLLAIVLVLDVVVCFVAKQVIKHFLT